MMKLIKSFYATIVRRERKRFMKRNGIYGTGAFGVYILYPPRNADKEFLELYKKATESSDDENA